MRYALFLIVSFSSLLLATQPSVTINKIKLDKEIDSLFQAYKN